MYDIRENEHQELFYLGIDPRQPVAIHIPSPLGRLGYYVFVRVPVAAVGQLAQVAVTMEVGGLMDDHVMLAPGEGATEPVVFPAKDAGYAWRCLGCGQVSRGNGALTLRNWPEDVARTDVLITTWARFAQSGLADDWIAGQADSHWAPTGVPLGAIGGGRIDLCRDGRFRNYSMNNNQDAPMEDPDGLPNAYLAVTADGATRELATRPVIAGHLAASSLTFDPRFPQATLRAAQLFSGLDVAVTCSGTLCPHDLRRSSLPGFLVRWTVTNTGAEARTVCCAMGWPNMVGVGGGIARAETSIGYGDGYYHHWDDPTGRMETVVNTAKYTGVRFTGTPSSMHRCSDGISLLAVAAVGQANASCTAGQGEVAVEVTVPAGGSAVATMALVVAMPHWIDSLGTERGVYWMNHFADADAMMTALLTENEEIFTEAGALSALLADSTLPDWLQHRLANCTYPLVTNSVFYPDGRFSINEGPTEMAGCYGTIDQRLAAHPATQILFPQLNATELHLFARIQNTDGSIAHDLGGGHLERPPTVQNWPDIPCSFIIQTARHAWSVGDVEFERQLFAHARAALLQHAHHADAGGGVPQLGQVLGTSYDSYHYFGTTAYMGTLWLAALAIYEKWAKRLGKTDLLDRVPQWREAAMQRLEADLWNGSYYDAYGNNVPGGPHRDTCHGGQLAGEVYARLLAGVDVLAPERLRSVLDALYRLNCNARFAIPPDEVSPDGASGADFGWLPYIEGFMLTAFAALDDARLWPVWERMVQAMDDGYRRPCDTRLMYRPDTGEISWGSYYMTAPASWMVYDAARDFFFAAGDGVLRLRTATPGRFPVVHPCCWAVADITADGAVTLTIRRVFGDAPLLLRTLEVPIETTRVTCGGEQLRVIPGQGRYVHCPLSTPVTLVPGAVIHWQVTVGTTV